MKVRAGDEVEFEVRVAGTKMLGRGRVEGINYRVAKVLFCGRVVEIFLSELTRVEA